LRVTAGDIEIAGATVKTWMYTTSAGTYIVWVVGRNAASDSANALEQACGNKVRCGDL